MQGLRNNPIYVFAWGFLFLIILSSNTVWSQVPQRINFQGFLTDPDGIPVPNGNYDMDFAIYDVPTGGAALWLESQIVMVINGIYNVQIGVTTDDPLASNPFPNDLFQGARYLGIKIAGESDEMMPRQQLTCTPFSMRAEVADKVADDAIGTSHIVDGSVAAEDLNTASVDARYINEAQFGSISSAMIQDGAALAEIMDNDGAESGLDADLLDGHQASHFATAEYVALLEARVAALETLLRGITRSGNDLYIDGANLHIRNGTGSTDGPVNGLGNLIVGYNELRGFGDNRSGSHNIIGGTRSNYSSFGGLVVGYNNTISGIYSTATGGYYGTASGGYSSVSGGNYNTASNWYSSVSGGDQNTASGNSSSVSGGRWNIASGQHSFVGGGGYTNSVDGNKAYADYSAILGGRQNFTGDDSNNDHAVGFASTISGGRGNTASGHAASVSGGYYNTSSSSYSNVSAGRNNIAGSTYTSVSGGANNTANFSYSSVSGGYYNTASGDYSSVSGGYSNTVSGNYASASGGVHNTASGIYSSVSGGYRNDAGADFSHVSGGSYNSASGFFSSVSGGYNNTAGGESASIGGGNGNAAPSLYSTVSGARPAYDSGWVTITSGLNVILEHNLGGDPDNYIVDLQAFGDFVGRHIVGFGGDYIQNTSGNLTRVPGFFYRLLDENRIVVERSTLDNDDQFRVRIWVNN